MARELIGNAIVRWSKIMNTNEKPTLAEADMFQRELRFAADLMQWSGWAEEFPQRRPWSVALRRWRNRRAGEAK